MAISFKRLELGFWNWKTQGLYPKGFGTLRIVWCYQILDRTFGFQDSYFEIWAELEYYPKTCILHLRVAMDLLREILYERWTRVRTVLVPHSLEFSAHGRIYSEGGRTTQRKPLRPCVLTFQSLTSFIRDMTVELRVAMANLYMRVKVDYYSVPESY